LFRVTCISGTWTSSFTKPHRKNFEGGQIWRSRRPGGGPPLADPSLRQLPIQECCHLIVGVWWCSVMLKKHFLLNSRRTVITDFVEWNSSTQNAFSGWVATYICAVL
jgi:hypothetical protein